MTTTKIKIRAYQPTDYSDFKRNLVEERVFCSDVYSKTTYEDSTCGELAELFLPGVHFI